MACLVPREQENNRSSWKKLIYEEILQPPFHTPLRSKKEKKSQINSGRKKTKNPALV